MNQPVAFANWEFFSLPSHCCSRGHSRGHSSGVVTTCLAVNPSKSTPPARVCTGIILILNLNRKVSWEENLGSNLSEPVVLTTHFYDSRMHRLKPETQYSANYASIDVIKITGGGGGGIVPWLTGESGCCKNCLIEQFVIGEKYCILRHYLKKFYIALIEIVLFNQYEYKVFLEILIPTCYS